MYTKEGQDFPVARIVRLISGVFVFCIFCSSVTYSEEIKSVKIGVLTQHGPGKCLAKWGPTAEYLTESVAGWSFSIVPLMPDELYSAVGEGDVDFALATSSLYVELEVFHGAGRIATLRNVYPDGMYTYFGGVLFCRSDRDDIRELEDFRGKKLMGLHKEACTAWHAVWLEMLENGVDPFKDLGNIEFGGSHKAIVEAVRNGSVDIGAVRSDTFERMKVAGSIKPDEFRVIHELRQEHEDVPFSHSTEVFSEKPIAKLNHTPDELAEKVAAALIAMSPDSPAAKAADCGGWTIPHNYQSVHDCLKTLRVSPYEDYGKVTLTSVFVQYGPWIVAIVVLIALVVGSVILIMVLRDRLSSAQKVILEHQISPGTVARIRDELSPYLQKQYMGRNDFEGFHSERVYALLAKAPSIATLVEHPAVLALADAILPKNYLLSSALAINVHPGETAQSFHIDDAPGGGPDVPRPRAPFGVSSIWALDDFTDTNGATEVIPGSHRWPAERTAGPEEAVQVLMPAGSVVVFAGNLIHRGGANRASTSRLAVTPQYCMPWMRQLENMTLAVPPELAGRYSERVQGLLGYSVNDPGFMGHVNGLHPKRLIREDYLGRKYRDDLPPS